MLLLVQSYAPYKAPYINCLELSPSQLASTFGSWFFLLLVRLNLAFILREDLLLCSSYLPLGVPNWVPNTHYQAIFLASSPGRKRIFARGVSRLQSFTLLLFFLFSLLYFFLLVSIKNTKNSSFYSWYFLTFTFSSLCCSLSTLWKTFQ
jgi:hypothetical protein